MHELGIMFNIVEIVERFADQNKLSKIDTLVLEIGELSSVVPRYIEACYPAAKDRTMLHDTDLKIELKEGIVKCEDCFEEYNLIQCREVCPDCGSNQWEIISGDQLMIKEIIAC